MLLKHESLSGLYDFNLLRLNMLHKRPEILLTGGENHEVISMPFWNTCLCLPVCEMSDILMKNFNWILKWIKHVNRHRKGRGVKSIQVEILLLMCINAAYMYAYSSWSNMPVRVFIFNGSTTIKRSVLLLNSLFVSSLYSVCKLGVSQYINLYWTVQYMWQLYKMVWRIHSLIIHNVKY